MKAAIRRSNALVLDSIGDPVPRAGEVLVKTLACGICGSGLHMMQHHCEQSLPTMHHRMGQRSVGYSVSALLTPPLTMAEAMM